MLRRNLYLALAISAALLPAFWLDMPVARWARASHDTGHQHGIWPGRAPRDVRKLLALSEVFAHATGVVLIGLTVYTLDPSSRRTLPLGACCALGGGLAADAVKLIVHRLRPEQLDWNQLQSSVWQTFANLPPPNLDSATQSFPSAHTATAVGLAVYLATLYPQGRWLFALFATLAGLQRIEGAHHYPTDVLAGALVGLLVATALTTWFPTSRRTTVGGGHNLNASDSSTAEPAPSQRS